MVCHLLFEHAGALRETREFVTAAIAGKRFPADVLSGQCLGFEGLSKRIRRGALHSFIVSHFRPGGQYGLAIRVVLPLRRRRLLCHLDL